MADVLAPSGHNGSHQPGRGCKAAFGYLGKAENTATALSNNNIIQANGCERINFSLVKLL